MSQHDFEIHATQIADVAIEKSRYPNGGLNISPMQGPVVMAAAQTYAVLAAVEQLTRIADSLEKLVTYASYKVGST